MKPTTVAVHDGIFHADDVVACAILSMVHSRVKFIRTRDPEILKNCLYRVDVGGKHDVFTNDFDHHQDKDLPAACTLVWDAYAQEIEGIGYDEFIYIKENLLAPISGLDCNYTKYVEENPFGVYKTIHQVISDFNRVDAGDEIQLLQFNDAVAFAKKVLENSIYHAKKRIKELDIIRKAQSLGEFGLVLSNGILYNELRKEIPQPKKILVFPDSKQDGWCVVSLDVDYFNLSDAKGEGMIFAHKVGFFVKWQTKDQAINFARDRSIAKSIELDNRTK